MDDLKQPQEEQQMLSSVVSRLVASEEAEADASRSLDRPEVSVACEAAFLQVPITTQAWHAGSCTACTGIAQNHDPD